MSRLSHPNVVKLHEVCSHPDYFCLAMDLYQGGTLCDLITDSRLGRLEENVAKVYLQHILRGLQHIHQRGVVHRDIKLENVFLNHDRSRAVIGDFGLSNLWSPGGVLKTRCGSAEYAAPELLDRKQIYGPAIDIWSSGVVLYAMVTGELPFTTFTGNVTKLFDQISLGLCQDHHKKLHSVSASTEVKILLHRILKVDVSKRITIPLAIQDPWFLELDTMEATPSDLSLRQQLEVAKLVKDKLKLLKWTPEQILTYVKSAKGKYGKTAGCFSLLTRDVLAKADVAVDTQNILKPVAAPKLVVSYAPAPKVAYKPYVDQYADEPAYYTYEYAVNDDYSNSAFDANESRDNYLTTGKYSVALPGEFNNTISGYNNTISCIIILFPGEST